VALFLRTETNSSRGHTRLRPPTVVLPAFNPTSQVVFKVRATLAWKARGSSYDPRRKPKPFLRAPVVVKAAPVVLYPVGVTLAPQKRGAPKSHLSLPSVAAATDVFFGPQTTLSIQSRGIPKSHLFPPSGGPGIAFHGPRIRLAKPLDTRPAYKSRLNPPSVAAAADVFFGPQTTLAIQSRGKAKSFLRAPVVVLAAAYLRAIDTTLAHIKPAPTHSVLRQPTVIDISPQVYYLSLTLASQRRGVPKSLLGKPSQYEPQQADVVYPTSITLSYSSRGKAKSFLRAPVVVQASAYLRAIQTHLAPSSHGKAKSRLAPPVTLASTQVFYGPVVTLAPSSRGKPETILRKAVVIDLTPQVFYLSVALVKIVPPPVHSRLRPPTDLVDQQDLGRVRVTLAPQKRGIPKSVLRKPLVIDLTSQTVYIATTLVRIRPVLTRWAIRRPTDLVDASDLGFVRVHLAYQSRGKPKSILRLPTVIDLRPQTYYLATTFAPSRFPKPKSVLRPESKFAPVPKAELVLSVNLAYSVSGKPKSRLRPPAVVGAGIYFRGVVVRLAPSRLPNPKSLLGGPTDLVDAQDLGFVAVTLAPSFRGKPKSRLNPPTVVAPFFARTVVVRLAPQKRGTPKSILRQPAVVTPRVEDAIADITIVRIRPASIHSVLRDPAVVGAGIYFRGILTHSAYSKRGQPKSILRPDSKFAPQPQADTTVLVKLAPQKRGKPKSVLRQPAVVTPRVEDAVADITLVRIRPAAVHSVLRDPAVVGAGIYFRDVLVRLAYSRRGQPKSVLRPDSKFAPQPQADTTVLVKLAPQKRGKPKSRLALPVVVGAGIYFRGILVRLAPSRFPKPKSRLLSVPAAFRPVGSVLVILAPSRFPRPKSRLRPPSVVDAFRIPVVSVTLAPQKRGIPKSLLRKPTDLIDAQDLGFVRIHLAYSLRGKAKSRLKQPTVVFAFVAQPTKIRLAPQRRGVQKSRLTKVVYEARVYAPIATTLTRITPPPVRSILRDPAVVGAGIVFRAIVTHLAYSRRGRTIWLLTDTDIVIDSCYGSVVGFDFSADVCGTDSAATVVGTSAAGGSVTGGDEKREGC
jgi:hypothetical protein